MNREVSQSTSSTLRLKQLEQRILKLSKDHKLLFEDYLNLVNDESNNYAPPLPSTNNHEKTIELSKKASALLKHLQREQQQLLIEKKRLAHIRNRIEEENIAAKTKHTAVLDPFVLSVISNVSFFIIGWGVFIGLYMAAQEDPYGIIVSACCLILLSLQKFLIQWLEKI